MFVVKLAWPRAEGRILSAPLPTSAGDFEVELQLPLRPLWG